MEMTSGLHCQAEMSYASKLEKEVFPETLLLIEAEKGSIELAAGMTIRITDDQGTRVEKAIPQPYEWVNPEYALVHCSIVDTQVNLAQGLRGGVAETTGEDNYQTSKLIWACYHSAEHQELVMMDKFQANE
jgi:hypothetical protein